MKSQKGADWFMYVTDGIFEMTMKGMGKMMKLDDNEIKTPSCLSSNLYTPYLSRHQAHVKAYVGVPLSPRTPVRLKVRHRLHRANSKGMLCYSRTMRNMLEGP
jgi:hypothetical protein